MSKLIGLAGLAGAGKDTAANIIQELCRADNHYAVDSFAVGAVYKTNRVISTLDTANQSGRSKHVFRA